VTADGVFPGFLPLVLCDLCLLPARFYGVIVYIRKFEAVSTFRTGGVVQ
jgi:hypothetical protein